MSQQPPRVVRKAHVFDEMADAWREILEVVSMPVSEPDTPLTPPPDFRPRKEMSCKACDIKFLNFNTWRQHQIVVHDMSIKDWTLVYEQRDALKRNRAQKRYALCLSRNPPIRPPICKKLLGSKRSPTDIIFVNHIDGSNTSMVDNELLAWMHECKQCSRTTIIGLQVNRCKSTAA